MKPKSQQDGKTVLKCRKKEREQKRKIRMVRYMQWNYSLKRHDTL